MITKVILFPLTFVRFLMEKRGKLQQCSFALYTEHDLVVEKGYEPLAASLRCLWLCGSSGRLLAAGTVYEAPLRLWFNRGGLDTQVLFFCWDGVVCLSLLPFRRDTESLLGSQRVLMDNQSLLVKLFAETRLSGHGG
jgi:hypothetical protein